MDGRLLVAENLPEGPRSLLEGSRLPGLWSGGHPLPGGRGTTRHLAVEGLDLAIKRERRGGLAGRFLPDLYFLKGPFIREWRVQSRLAAMGLAPAAVAVEFAGGGGLFRVYSASVMVAGAQNLAKSLERNPEDLGIWRRAGEAVGRLHGAGALHGDLNAGNLLLAGDAGGGTLFLDLRHSSLSQVSPPWRDRRRNLSRLARSLHKTAWKRGDAWPESGWEALAEGYAAGFGEREDWLERWRSSAARPPHLRRLLWHLLT